MDQEIADLDDRTKANLIQICRQKGLSPTGSKRDLVRRVREVMLAERNQRQLREDGAENENDNDDDDHSARGGNGARGAQTNIRNRVGSINIISEVEDLRLSKTTKSFSFKDVEESFEYFSGADHQDVVVWLDDFDEQAAILGWKDLEKLVYGRRLTKGEAKQFILSELKPKTWNELKDGLKKEYSIQVNSQLIHRKLEATTKKADETFREYCYRMINIASPAKIDEPSLINYIVDGIPESKNNKMFLYTARSISDLKEKLRVYETVQPKKDSSKKADKKNGGRSKEKRNVCYNCGDAEHESKNCPDKDKGPKCFGCNNFGHLSKDCTTKKEKSTTKPKDKKKDDVAQVLCLTKDRTRVHKEIELNGKKINCMFDTGSDFNVMREEKFRSDNFGELKPTTFRCRGVGSVINGIGEFDVKIFVDNCWFNDKCFVIPSKMMQEDLLIGLSLINQANIELNESGLKVMKRVTGTDKVPQQPNDDGDWCELPICAHLAYDEQLMPELCQIVDKDVKNEVLGLITGYQPKKVKKSPVELKIIMKDETPIYRRPRRLPPSEKQIVDAQIKEWLQKGIIRPSKSDFASNVVLVDKKDKTKRVCVDYRWLNKNIVKDRYPLPNVESDIDELQGAKVYSCVDLENGFFHVPIEEESRKYTAFITANGHYEFNVVPFGLCVSPAIFQRFINTIFAELVTDRTVIVYMDDVIIPAIDEREAVTKLRRMLTVGAENGLKIKWKKCSILQRRVEFLGYEIEDGMIRAAKSKTNDVKKYREPKDASGIQKFLGFAGYFRKFIQDFALIAKPLYDLLKKGVKFEFSEIHRMAFEKLKQIITERPVLMLFQYGLETELHTDASKYGLAAILMQRNNDDNQMHPVRFLSLKTTEAEQKFCSYELEVLAIVKALQRFRVYLLGQNFKIVTDCKAFESTMNNKNVPKIARWVLQLQEYDFKVDHRAGKRMPHVDALSRMYIIQEEAISKSIRKAQNDDESMRPIIELAMQKGEYDHYIIKNDLLHRLKDDRELIVIPSSMEFEILRRAHEQGHFKAKKMQDIIEREFYIAKLKEKTERYVKSCVTCILSDRKAGKSEGLLNPIPKEDVPLHTLHLDHLGPLKSTRKSYNHILAVIDAFTKFTWIFPVKSTTSEETVQKLQVIGSVFGNPARVVTDKGTAFTGSAFTDYCKAENISVVHTTTGVPRGNGQIERLNRTIISVLSKLSSDDPEKWFMHTNRVQQVINKTYQRSIGTTPFELLVGVPMKTKDDIEIKKMIEEESIKAFNEERDELRKRAKSQILRVQDENRRSFNAKRKPATQYSAGDLVAIKRTQFGGGLKLKANNFGPYEVIKSNGNDRYEVRKVGIHDGPYATTSSADHMCKWPEYN